MTFHSKKRTTIILVAGALALALATLLFSSAAPASTENRFFGAVANAAEVKQDLPALPALASHAAFATAALTITEQVYLPLLAKQPPQPLGSLADGWYLMVDDGHIASRNVQRLYHPFKKHSGNPILRADKSWEGRVVYLYGAVMPGFRMWYSSLSKDWGTRQILYAESQDGLHWTKPDLDGTGRNVLFGGSNGNLISVLDTPHDIPQPMKMMVYQDKAFQGYWSPNGTQLYGYPENPLLKTGGDVALFYLDPFNFRYGGTFKESALVRGIQRRILRFASSSDYINWSVQPETLEPDLVDDQLFAGLYPHFYGMPVFASGEQYLDCCGCSKHATSPDCSGR